MQKESALKTSGLLRVVHVMTSGGGVKQCVNGGMHRYVNGGVGIGVLLAVPASSCEL